MQTFTKETLRESWKDKKQGDETMEEPIKTNEETKQKNEGQDISGMDIPVFESNKGRIDLHEFEGQKVKIVKAMVIDNISSYDVTGHFQQDLKRPVKKIKVMTEAVTEMETKDGKIEIRASELFGMKEKDGLWGISDSPKAGIMKFLKRQKVDNINKLVGTFVIVKATDNDDGKTFLGFIKE